MINDGRTSRQVLDDVCECRKLGGYCLLKELMLASGPDDRTLEQLKCVEKFKYERKITGNDGGWQSSLELWIKEGFAKKFADVYKPGMKYDEIYDRIMGRNQEATPTQLAP